MTRATAIQLAGPQADAARRRTPRLRRGAWLRRGLRRFAQDDGGGPTIEFVIWVMPFIWIVAFFLDLSLYFNARSDMMRATREAARYVAVGALQPSDVASYVGEAIGRTVSFDVAVSGTGTVSLQANVPTADATIFGMIDLLGQEFITFTTAVRREVDVETIETGEIDPISML